MNPLKIAIVFLISLAVVSWFYPIVLVLHLVVIAALAIFGFQRIPANAPPAPRGQLPFFGHLLSIGKRADVVYKTWWQQHGDIVSIRLGEQLCVLISSPTLHREAYGTHGRSLLERPPLMLRQLTGEVLGGAGVLWSAGADWRAHRAFVNSAMLSSRKVMDYVPAVFAEVQRCVLGFERATANAPHDVDVSPRLFSLAMNALSQAVLARRLFDVDEGLGSETRSAVMKIFEVLGEPYLADYVRVLRKIAPTPPSFVECRAALTHISDIVDAAFEERSRLSESEKAKARCVLDDVVELDRGDAAQRLSSAEALRSIKELINAGGETTTAVLTWALVAAAEHPREVQRAVDELDRVVGKQADWVTPEHLAKDLPVFDAWIKETVRLWPLARVTVPRITTEPITIGGYVVPASTMVLIHRQAIMMHPEFWSEPERFKLERFLPGGEAGPEVADTQWAFVMFGAGPRVCPGSNLALWEVRLTLANLLRRFRVEYSPSFPFDYRTDTETKLTTQPKGNKLVMRFEKRR